MTVRSEHTATPASLALRTPICERIGIEYPVFQAGMGWVARAELAAAVSEAGGLGVIGAGTDMAADELRRQIAATRELTDKPFGVDILFATVRATGSEAARYSGKPCRMIRNQFTDSWEARQDEIEPYPLQALHVGHAASELGRHRGDTDHGVLPAGQSSGLIRAVKPAGQVVRDVIAEAGAALERLAQVSSNPS